MALDKNKSFQWKFKQQQQQQNCGYFDFVGIFFAMLHQKSSPSFASTIPIFSFYDTAYFIGVDDWSLRLALLPILLFPLALMVH